MTFHRLLSLSAVIALAGCTLQQNLGAHDGALDASRGDADGAMDAHVRGGPGCRLPSAAFCETFDAPSPGGRGGEIDETRWAFSRWSATAPLDHRVRAQSREMGILTWSNPDGPPTLCGEEFSGVLPPDDDVRVCGGQLEETLNDAEADVLNAAMIRQPFDFTGRMGTIVFDVDAKRSAGWDIQERGWWLEIWITDEPIPTVGALPRNAVGFRIAPYNDAADDLHLNTAVGVTVFQNGIRDMGVAGGEGPAFQVQDRLLNRFEVMLSEDTIIVRASDAGTPSELRQILRVDRLDLTFSVGFVHFIHRHLNASSRPSCGCEDAELRTCECDCGPGCLGYPNGFFASPTQTFRWDNVGFDGPRLPMLRAYDVPDSLDELDVVDDEGHNIDGLTLSYNLENSPASFVLDGVDLAGVARATLDFTCACGMGSILRQRYNGGEWREYVVPAPDEAWEQRGLSIPVELGDLVDGANTIDLEGNFPVANIDLTLHPAP